MVQHSNTVKNKEIVIKATSYTFGWYGVFAQGPKDKYYDGLIKNGLSLSEAKTLKDQLLNPVDIYEIAY